MIKSIFILGMSGIYFMFAALAWTAIKHPLPYTDGFQYVWGGLLVAVVAAWLFTLKLIWEFDND